MADIEPMAQVIIARFYIREYATVGWADSTGSGGVSGPDAALPAPQEPGIDQVLTLTADPPMSEAVQSAAFAPSTRFVALYCHASFHYVVGADPTATRDNFRLPGLTRFYIGVKPGDKMSVISAI